MYESFYKLHAKPFHLSPDPRFFYPGCDHKRALAYLRYGLSQGEGFVVITGAPGTGKTTLAQFLLKELKGQDQVIAHLTTTQLEADDMLRMVVASFGLRYEKTDKAVLLKRLETFLFLRSQEHKRALLVIDEAQNLPARSLEELRMLSNLQAGDRGALLQIFLLGQPQFRQMLEHPDQEQLRQRVIASSHLSFLTPDECRDYIETRLKQAGWQGDPHFTEQAYAIIHEYSEGVPRRINMLCERVLLFGYLEELHEINATTLWRVTDELEQEIPGRPLPAKNPVENQLNNPQADLHMGSLNQQMPEMQKRAVQSQKRSKVIELAPARKYFTQPAEAQATAINNNHLSSSEQAGSQLDYAEPKEFLHDPAPQTDPGRRQERASQKEPENGKSGVNRKERFRVISGGKDAKVVPDKLIAVPSPASQEGSNKNGTSISSTYEHQHHENRSVKPGLPTDSKSNNVETIKNADNLDLTPGFGNGKTDDRAAVLYPSPVAHDKERLSDGNSGSSSTVRNTLLTIIVIITLFALYITQVRGIGTPFSILEYFNPNATAPAIKVVLQPEPQPILRESGVENSETFRVSEPPAELETDLPQMPVEQIQVEETTKTAETAETKIQVQVETKTRAETSRQPETKARAKTEPNVAPTVKTARKPHVLTEADLNHLVAAFVEYYERGDIKEFMDLFSSDAQTNNHSTLADILNDYQDLFENTPQRHMELKNLRWSMDGSIARGESDYMVELLMPGSGKTDVYKGALWIQVESREGLSRITYLNSTGTVGNSSLGNIRIN